MKKLLTFILVICWLGLLPTFSLAQEAVEEVVAETVAPVEVAAEAVVETPVAAPEEDGDDDSATVATALAAAPEMATDGILPVEENVGGLIQSLADGIASKNWSLVTGAGILILVWLFNFVLLKFWTPPVSWKNVLPWIAIVIGCLAQFAACLVSGTGWADALNMGIVTGLVGSGSWSAYAKHAERKMFPPKAS